MTTALRISLASATFFVSLGCGSNAPPVQTTPPPAGGDPVMPSAECLAAAGSTDTTNVSSDVAADSIWAGTIILDGTVIIPNGIRVEVCPSAIVRAAPGTELVVAGELSVAGTADARARFEAASWTGITVEGSLQGSFFELGMATRCLDVKAGGTVRITDAAIAGCVQAFRIGDSATFERVQVIGGGTLLVTAGVLQMIDSSVDLRHPRLSPDCMVWNGGGATFDHVRVTGCHCPLHINRADLPVTVTNSIFDDAAYPVMIAHAQATFTGNHFLGGAAHMQDVGGDIDANVAGNYWDGGAPNIDTREAAQFKGASDFLTSPVEGVGPR